MHKEYNSSVVKSIEMIVSCLVDLSSLSTIVSWTSCNDIDEPLWLSKNLFILIANAKGIACSESDIERFANTILQYDMCWQEHNGEMANTTGLAVMSNSWNNKEVTRIAQRKKYNTLSFIGFASLLLPTNHGSKHNYGWLSCIYFLYCLRH